MKTSDNILKQGAMLALTLFIVKIIGFIYRIPLTNLIGDEGNAIYSASFNIYVLFVLVSVTGLPVAISRLVSAEISKGRYLNAHKIFKISMMLAILVGTVSSLTLFFGADMLEKYLTGVKGSGSGIKVLAPTVLVVSIMGVYRGYFQGMKNFVPTSISQTVEQGINAVGSLVFAYVLINMESDVLLKNQKGATGGTVGTLVGAIAGLLVLLYIYKKAKPHIIKNIKSDGEEVEKNKILLKRMIATIIPIVVGTVAFSISNIIDNKLIVTGLVQKGYTELETMVLYGQYAVKYLVIANLPIGISGTFATVSIPIISSMKNKIQLDDKVNSVFRISMLISIPSAVGIYILSNEIIRVLFVNEVEGGNLLRVGSISIVFMTLSTVFTAILQGVGKERIPVISAFIGLSLKIPMLYYLIIFMGINGAIIASTIASFIMATLNYYYLKNVVKINFDIKGCVVKPLISSAVMGIVTYYSYKLSIVVTMSNTTSVFVSVLASIIIYTVMLLLTKSIKEEDLLMFPKSDRIIKILKRNNKI